MQIINSNEVLVPAGLYALGDPCYTVPDDKWSELLASNEVFGTPVGTYSTDAGVISVVAFGTAHGDGVYSSVVKNGSCLVIDVEDYGVDAGLIGLVEISESQVEEVRTKGLSSVVRLHEATKFTYTNGLFSLGDVVSIDTDPTDAFTTEW